MTQSDRPVAKSRAEWDAMEARGECPECGQQKCDPNCRKLWFDRGFRHGFHDGANNMDATHDGAFYICLSDTVGELNWDEEV